MWPVNLVEEVPPRFRFVKAHGTGNDFIILDMREQAIPEAALPHLARTLCRPHLSVGADGVLALSASSSQADVRMRLFNPDGSEGEMCGNGARCAVRYECWRRGRDGEVTLDTLAGPVWGRAAGASVQIRFRVAGRPELGRRLKLSHQVVEFDELHVGVPHIVLFQIPPHRGFAEIGRQLVRHPTFPRGTNVNLVRRTAGNGIRVRTYERGVNRETLACGTGVVASLMACSARALLRTPAPVDVRGGRLVAEMGQLAEGRYEVGLTGSVVLVAEGEVLRGAWLGPEQEGGGRQR